MANYLRPNIEHGRLACRACGGSMAGRHGNARYCEICATLDPAARRARGGERRKRTRTARLKVEADHRALRAKTHERKPGAFAPKHPPPPLDPGRIWPTERQIGPPVAEIGKHRPMTEDECAARLEQMGDLESRPCRVRDLRVLLDEPHLPPGMPARTR